MSRSFPAKYAGNCPGCTGKIDKGTSIRMIDGDAWHAGCAPTGPGGTTTRDDREYQRGAREAVQYMEDRDLMGEEYAAAEEHRRMMRDPDGW